MKTLLSILLTLITTIGINAQNWDVRFKQTSVNCQTKQVCYDVQFKINGNGPFVLAGQNYRIYYDASKMSFAAGTSYLPSPVYTGLVLVQNTQVDADYINGSLPFESTLGFLNFYIDLNDYVNGGIPLSTTDWVSTASLCFNVDDDVFANNGNCLEMVFAREGYTDEYASAFMQASRWVAPNQTTGADGVDYYDLTSTNGSEACLASLCADTSSYNIRLKLDTVNCETNEFCYNVQLQSSGGNDVHLAGQNYRIYWDAEVASFKSGMSVLPIPMYTNYTQVQLFENQNASGYGPLPFEDHLSFINYTMDLTDLNSGGIVLPAGVWTTTSRLCFTGTQELFDNPNVCMDVVFARPGLTDGYATAFMEVAEWISPTKLVKLNPNLYFDMNSQTMGSEACLDNVCIDTSTYDIRLTLDTVNCDTKELCYDVQLRSSGGNNAHLAGQNYRIYWDAEVASFKSGMSVLPTPMYTNYTQVQLLENQNASGYGPLPFEDHLSFINYTMDLTDLNSGGIVLPSGVWTTTSRLCFTGTQELFDNPNVCMDVVFARPGLTDGYATAFMEVSEWKNPTKLVKMNPDTYFDMNSQTMGSEACLDNVCIDTSTYDIRLTLDTVNCDTKELCYDVQLRSSGGNNAHLAGQNYRIYWDAEVASFKSGMSVLPTPMYTNYTQVQLLENQNASGYGPLPFEDHLSFINYTMDLTDLNSGGIVLPSGVWTTTSRLCFTGTQELFDNPNVCMDVVFARPGLTDGYATAFMEVSEWKNPTKLVKMNPDTYFDMNSQTMGSEACLDNVCIDTSTYDIRLTLDTVNCDTKELCYDVQLRSSGGNNAHLAGQNYRIYWDAEVASFKSGMSVLPTPMYTNYTQVQLLENQNASGYGPLPFEDHLSFINYTMDLTDLNSGGIVLPSGVWTTTSRLCFTGTQELFDNPNVCMDVVFARPGLTDGYATAFMEVSEWKNPTKLVKMNPDTYFDMNSQTMGSEACLDNVCIDTSTYDIRLTLDTVNCDTKELCYDVQLRSSGGNNAHLAGQNYRIYWDAEVASFKSGMSVLPTPMYTNYTQVQLLENQNASGYGPLPFEDHLSFINYTMDLTDLNSGGIVLPSGVWTTTSRLCFTGTQELFDNPNVCMDVVFARPGLTDGYATAFMEVSEWKNPTKLVKMNPDTYFDMNSQTMGAEACITPYCPCDIPVLTVGDVECTGTGFSVLVVHNGQNITSSAGVISGNYINNIPLGTSVTITSSNRAGCESTIIVNGPSTCLNTCGFPKLIVGQGKCSSNGFYEISYTESTGAILSVNAGTINGNSVINIPIGTNLIMTASNGNCTLSYEVVSPSDCDNICGQPHISVSRTECESGNLSYSINFIQTSGATLTSSHGTVGAGVVSGIPAGQAVTLTVSLVGCPDQVLVVPAPVCGCERPVLTTGDITCEGNSYSVIFFHNGSSISASAGTVSGNKVINIPLGTNVTITSSNGAGCSSTITVTGPTVCQTTCNYPTLNAGQGVCSGNNTYSVSFTESTGAVISVNAGTISGNSVINIPLGTNAELTATNGACVVKITVVSPQSCGDVCEQPHVSVSRTECAVGNTSYSVYYTLVSGATLTSSHGTVGAGVVSGIPAGQAVTLTVSLVGCPDQVLVVPAPVCGCERPVLTTGDITCEGNSYSVIFFHNGSSISASAGTVSGNMVINIPLGTNVTITSSNGAGCSSTITVTGPTVCQTTCNYPTLNAGQGVCSGNNTYSVSFTESTGAVISVNAGTISGNSVINIPLGTNAEITATNGACVVKITVVSPQNCGDVCEQPHVSVSRTECAVGNTSYSVYYTLVSGATLTSSHGTVGAGVVSGIPAGQAVTLTVSFAGCPDQVLVVPAPVCGCERPVLTTGDITCAGNSYSVVFFHNGSSISASAGTVSGNKVINIPLGTNVTITSSNGAGCSSTITVTGPTVCQTTCNYPTLNAGQGVCSGNNTYSVSFTESTGAVISVNAGTISGNSVINIPLGTNAELTATNGACVVKITVVSPQSCGDVCEQPHVSVSRTECAVGNTSYSVYYTLVSGATLTSSHGTVGAGVVSGIPAGQAVTLTVSFAGCPDQVLVVPAPVCGCERPVLTTGDITCAGNSYSVIFFHNGSSISVSAGTVSGNKVINIPLGTNVTITSSNGAGCSSTITVTGPAVCQTTCNYPTLNAGQGVCSGNNTYSVSFTESTGAVISVNAGTISGNSVINIPLGTNAELTATNGACVVKITVVSPQSCGDVCEQPHVSVSRTECAVGNTSYSVYYTLVSGATLTSSHGTVGAGVVSGIPAGQAVTLTVSFAGCPDQVLVVPAPVCGCERPVLTTGDITCEGNSYSVIFFHNGSSISVNAGTVSGNKVINIPLGTNVTITSSNGAGCSSTITVTGPTVCQTTCNYPTLNAGQGVCSGNNTYSVSFTESTGAVISVNAGTISGNSVINIPLGTNAELTATNGACVVKITVVSPQSCGDVCEQPHVSVSRTECAVGNTSYSVYYTLVSGATLTSSHGTVGAGVVSGIPAGQAVTLTVSFAGCPDQVLVVPAPVCGCERPVLTTGDITCAGNSYSVIFFHNGSSISVSAGTVSGNKVINIPLGTNVTITSSNGAGCSSTITVTGPTVCQTTCNYPTLNAGQGVCSGNNTYSVSFTESTGAVISVNAGTISGNSVINIPLGTNAELTATNGACVVKITVVSPQSCGDVCEQPHVSVSRTECAVGNTSYSVYYTLVSGATLTSSHGTVGAGVVSGIPAGQAVTLTVSLVGCPDQVLVVPAPVCGCERPVLTTGDITCAGNSYSVIFFHNGSSISVSAGTVSGNKVINIPLGTNVTITSSNGAGCSSTITVTGPTVCQTTCNYPTLNAGQGVCSGNNTYSVSFTESTGAVISVNAGTISGNSVINIPLGTNAELTATNGACVVKITVVSPQSCGDVCEQPHVSVSRTECAVGNTSYSVYYTLVSGATLTSSHGTVGAGVVSGIPAGQAVTLTVSLVGCPDQVLVVPAPVCGCERPVLTTGDITCAGNSYSVIFFHNGSSISVSAGTVSGNKVINIPLGTNVTITSSNGAGCSSTITVTGPTVCQTTCNYPTLNAGQGVCSGNNTYSVSFTESTGAVISVNAGTISGNSVINIPLGTNAELTATNGACVVKITVVSPQSCGDVCEQPHVSVSRTECAVGNTSYSVYYTLVSGATLTSSHGTVGAGVVSGIPAGQAVTLTVSLVGCPDQVLVVPAPVCGCERPVLTTGDITCAGNSYSVIFFHNGSSISVSAGTVSGNKVINIPLGTNVTITSSNGAGCSSTITVTGPTVCQTTCNYPTLNAGQGVCSGNNTYSVSFTESTGAVISVNAGTISGNSVINIPLGTNAELTATNGACVVKITVVSPQSCGDVCEQPHVSVSRTECAVGNTSYSVYYTLVSGATLTSSHGTVGAGVVSGIPAGQAVTLTVSFAGCPDQVLVVPAPVCGCERPVLTTGDITCAGNSYSVIFFHNGSSISVSAGTVSGNKVINIPLGTNVTITSSNGAGCSSTITVTGPTVCQTTCNYPTLNAGQGVCSGNNTYSVSFTESTGAVISVNAGTISGNSVINIPLGTNAELTATNGACVVKITVVSPQSCGDVCEQPHVSVSRTECAVGNTSYSVYYTLVSGATLTSSHGTVGAGVVSGIPVGQAVTLTVSFAGCPDQVLVVPAPVCGCERPVLTTGDITCAGNSYSVIFFHNGSSISVSAGTVSGNKVINIPLGTNVTITSSNGAGCSSTITVTGPTVCQTTCNYPTLNAGQGVCSGNNTYSVSFTESTGAVISVNAGTISGNSVINIPLGTNAELTATNGACVVKITVVSPQNCGDVCEQPHVSVSRVVCSEGDASYNLHYVINSGATITSNYGVVNNGVITGIPIGQTVTLTVKFAGCEDQVIVVPAPVCIILSAIGNYVWHDLNGNGVQDLGEPGIAGVQVNLYRANGAYVGTVYTDASGYYLFDHLYPGDYYLEFKTPAGYDKTFFKRGGDISKDSDIDGSHGVNTTQTIHLGPGVKDLTWDAGYYKCIPIGDLVWYDINKNDIWDTNENGINGLQVNLWKNYFGEWIIWDHTFTGHKPGTPSDDGYWSFCAPPGEYYVEVIMPPLGLVKTRPNIGSNKFIDSDITDANGPTTTDKFVVTSGSTKLDLGAGFYPQATAGSLVWKDANSNGVRDDGEEMIEGVKVEAILASSHEVVGSAVTDVDGVYELEALEKQSYYFRFTPPAGYYPTLAAMTSDDKDSDVDHSNGLNTTRSFAMQPETAYKNIDMGIMFAPLPLEWLDVKAFREGEMHIVKWKVGQEINVSYYEVERKLDTDNEFKVIPGKLDAKGRNSLATDYLLKDYDVSRTGVYLYRVKQFDLNGNFTYSKIVKVVHSGKNSIDMYPNPANSETNIMVNLTQDAVVNIEIFDGASRLVKVVHKSNIQLAGDKTYKVDLANLAAGVYNVVITVDGVQTQKKLIRIE